MKSTWLLVTTSKSFLLINKNFGSGYRIDEGRGLYYGISIDKDQILIGARRRLVSSDIPQNEESGQILAFDRCWNCDSVLMAPFPLRDIHQILLHQGQLWVTCAFDNCIAIYDYESCQWEDWYPLGFPQNDPKDVNHFNSLSIFDQNLCILAHNKGDSDLLFFKLPDRTFVDSIRLGKQAHNIWRQNDAWATCSSAEGKLIDTKGFTVNTGGFPRGIAFLDEEICVGISEIAERSQRDFTTGHLLFFDYRWNFKYSIDLLEEGLVLDISMLPDTWNKPIKNLLEFPITRI